MVHDTESAKELTRLREVLRPGKIDWDALLELVRHLQGELSSCQISYRVQLRVATQAQKQIRDLTESLTEANQHLATQEFVIAGLRNGIEKNLPTLEKVGMFFHEMIHTLPEVAGGEERKAG